MVNISISEKPYHFANIDFEVVERKGFGHPDTMSDALSDIACQVLCKYYEKKYGLVLPHHVNKVMILGGETNPEFNGGVIKSPIKIIIGGIASTEVFDGKKSIEEPIFEIIVKALSKWLKKNFPYLDVDRNVVFQDGLRKGASNLTLLDKNHRVTNICEDTSVGVGYAPLSKLEKIVLDVENHLNSFKFKKKYPQIGSEVKIMGVRKHDDFSLILAVGMVSKLIPNIKYYNEMKNLVKEESMKICEKYDIKPKIAVNAFDNVPENLRSRTHTGTYGKKYPKPYMLVTGTHSERGRGATGRGNRINGLITPMRLMSIEAPAGKLPSHPGKLYSLAAFDISEKIIKLPEVCEADTILVSKIGSFINRPADVIVNVGLKGVRLSKVKDKINHIVKKEVEDLEKTVNEFLDKPRPVY